MLTLILLLLMAVFFPGVLFMAFILLVGGFIAIITSPIFWMVFLGVFLIQLILK